MSESPEFIHRLVLDFLKHSGRAKAAECFEKEAEFSLVTKSPNIQERGEIRKKILSGDIIGAIDLINDLNPEILDSHEDLVFELRLQAFIEMIRIPGYDLEEVLSFATEEFVPCPTHLLPRLEEVMALLAFENADNSPLREVLHRRERTAARVNDAILSHFGTGPPELAKVLGSAIWMDHYCRRRNSSSVSSVEEPYIEKEECDWFFSEFL